MTFFIKELVFNATQTAWDAIEDDMNIRRHLFLLRGEPDHNWSQKNHKHDYSDAGLFFIRPICSQASSAFSWLAEEERVANPKNLLMTQDMKLNVDPIQVQTRTCLSPESFKEECPLNVLRFAKVLSQIIGSNVVYYDACYWGGMVEYELAWIFGDREDVIVQLTDSEKQTKICTISANAINYSEGDTLQTALKSLGVNMSSGYFLPHTRGFNWAEQRIR